MNKFDSYEKLYEILKWCTEDTYSFKDFYLIEDTMSDTEKKFNLDITMGFLYRCIKCELLVMDIGYENYPCSKITSLEKLFQHMATIELDNLFSIKNWNGLSGIDEIIWIGEQVFGTEKLKEISNECGIETYVDVFSKKDNKWRKFIMLIDKLFLENGIPWNVSEPLKIVG